MTAQLSVKEVLDSLDVGNSVAEFDNSLEKYFVENEAFRALVHGVADIVAGDKGTGKTAVYRILQRRHKEIPELNDIEVLAGFNPSGNPIFQKLVQHEVLTEGQYSAVWKTYFLSLVGNWIISSVGAARTEKIDKLYDLLKSADLLSEDNKPASVFGKIVESVQRYLRPDTAEMEMTLSETGVPIITPRVTFAKGDGRVHKEVPHEVALRLLDDCLEQMGKTVWIALDRLDEAFQGFPQVEVPALRALMRTYLDLMEFERFRLKLFVRRDLFRRIIGSGFVNLTHLNARKKEIIWSDVDLLNLLCRRVRDNAQFLNYVGGNGLPDELLFYKIFPPKVDQATRKPTTLNWVMSRVKDGNEIRPPRNLIDLVALTKDEQLRADSRGPQVYTLGAPLVLSDSIRAAHSRLSAQRVEDTLLAEAGPETAGFIRAFRRAKAEQNTSSLGEVLGLEGVALQEATRQLVDIGFLEELKATWKVPILYREGLEITQGKAFSSEEFEDDE